MLRARGIRAICWGIELIRTTHESGSKENTNGLIRQYLPKASASPRPPKYIAIGSPNNLINDPGNDLIIKHLNPFTLNLNGVLHLVV